MSAAFVLARFSDPDKLLPAIDQVRKCAPVSHWSAVDGDIHLVMKVTGPASSLPDEIKKLSGISQMTAYDIIGPDGEISHAAESDDTRAYLFIDAEPNRQKNLLDTLRGLPETVCCTAVKGGCDLVALVKGDTITALQRTIDEKIRPMDGVLRLKHNHVIDLTKL